MINKVVMGKIQLYEKEEYHGDRGEFTPRHRVLEGEYTLHTNKREVGSGTQSIWKQDVINAAHRLLELMQQQMEQEILDADYGPATKNEKITLERIPSKQE